MLAIHSVPPLPRISSSLDGNRARDQEASSSSSIPTPGKIRRLVLSPEGRTKMNSSPDRDFYSFPRFVTHVDDGFISTLTDVFRERLKPGWEVLDLMSSWVSHLPKDVDYKRVVGHGMNAMELARNPRLEYFFVKDLNLEQRLPLEDSTFDAVLCTVSVQYLQYPEKVFAEVFRVLKPGGVFIISFSNRAFYEKAISAWRDGTSYSRVQLVVQYFQCIDGFTQPEIVRRLPGNLDNTTSPLTWLLGLFGLSQSDPFYAVIAYKNFKPI
ncbi:hypothetical protein J5N97_020764 [Dioscorea zingiberensis]|uniref:Methyltransferase type 11 domain-containing protein n=1 Tax=Dioscorea zingiberensis TaxID=325984 RepID=A0A9D5CIN4_9LILI|nr:hypothetical protein J5N97_020764 [Dioscorea zingiberensis]